MKNFAPLHHHNLKIFDHHTFSQGFSITLIKSAPTNCPPCQQVKSAFELYAEIAK